MCCIKCEASFPVNFSLGRVCRIHVCSCPSQPPCHTLVCHIYIWGVSYTPYLMLYETYQTQITHSFTNTNTTGMGLFVKRPGAMLGGCSNTSNNLKADQR